MTKRKISDYYRAVSHSAQAYQDARDKRYFSAALNARRAYRSLPSRSNMVARKSFLRARASKRRPRRRVVKRKRVARKPRRRTRKTPKNGVQWKPANILSLDYDNADTRVVSAGSAIQGKRCQYIYNGVSTATAQPLGCIAHIGDMTQEITQISDANDVSDSFETKFIIKNSKQVTTVINTSNASVLCQSYFCRVRYDIGTGQNYQDLCQLLGDGFFQRGLDTQSGSANSGVSDASLSPFDSHKFCSYFNIFKVQKYELEAGATKMLTVQTNKSYTVNTAHLFTGSSRTFPPTFSPCILHKKGEMFVFTKFEGIPADSQSGQWYTTPKLDTITKTHYNYVMLSPNPPTLLRKPATGYTAPGANALTIMQEESGNNVPQTNA
uniref:Capsid protein n=1 Tax=Red panda circovirus 5 TaxID=2863954 RepID=A0A8K1HHK7_9CIRC|nr:capsid protein [Red panda circovirus 5]